MFYPSSRKDTFEVIVLWSFWQQNLKLKFIEAGWLIKQRCTKPPYWCTGTIFLYGYCKQATDDHRFACRCFWDGLEGSSNKYSWGLVFQTIIFHMVFHHLNVFPQNQGALHLWFFARSIQLSNFQTKPLSKQGVLVAGLFFLVVQKPVAFYLYCSKDRL